MIGTARAVDLFGLVLVFAAFGAAGASVQALGERQDLAMLYRLLIAGTLLKAGSVVLASGGNG